MELDGYRPRIADAILEDNLKSFGAVCVEGPMWCGKTWTAKRQAASACMIGDSADNFAVMERVAVDIDYAFDGAEPRLIDEWQVFPALWDATRSHVDAKRGRGRFILTGSSTPPDKGVLHSGAGRIATMRMRPMCLWESGAGQGAVSLADVMAGRNPGVVDVPRPALERIVELVLRGGWPATTDDEFRFAAKTPRAYVRRLLDRDIPGLDGVNRDRRKLDLLLRSLARNESTTASTATIAGDVAGADGGDARAGGVSDKTAGVYLNALDRLFVTENIRPFSPFLRSRTRVVQSEKRHFCDPSVPAAILRATPEKLLADLRTLGFLFESLVLRDLLSLADAIGASVYHYRDYKGREIDAVLDMPDGEWAGVEIKLGSNQVEAAAANLLDIAAAVKKEGGKPPDVLAVVVGLAGAAFRRKDGVYVLPVMSLRP